MGFKGFNFLGFVVFLQVVTCHALFYIYKLIFTAFDAIIKGNKCKKHN